MTLVLAALIAACTPEGSSRQLPELPPLPPRLSVAATEPGEARPLREAIVAFTAADRGEVEVCGCPTTPYGGFSRRAELYRRLGDAQVPFFAVDAGEMLVKGLTGRDEADRQVRATAVLDLAKTAGLDAWAASPVDLLPGGLPFLRERGALAANWNVPAPDGLAPASIVERDGVKLGFIGLAAPAKDVPGVDAVASVRAAMIARISTPTPTATNFIERSRSVRRALARAFAAPAPKSANPERMPCRMIGSERSRLMRPPAATAPAPIYRL